jgi:hypothetical protein
MPISGSRRAGRSARAQAAPEPRDGVAVVDEPLGQQHDQDDQDDQDPQLVAARAASRRRRPAPRAPGRRAARGVPRTTPGAERPAAAQGFDGRWRAGRDVALVGVEQVHGESHRRVRIDGRRRGTGVGDAPGARRRGGADPRAHVANGVGRCARGPGVGREDRGRRVHAEQVGLAERDGLQRPPVAGTSSTTVPIRPCHLGSRLGAPPGRGMVTGSPGSIASAGRSREPRAARRQRFAIRTGKATWQRRSEFAR